MKRKTPLRAKKSFTRGKLRGAIKKPVKRKNGPHKGYQIPYWFSKLPYRSSDHGTSSVHKRAWRVVSQTYRQQDFEQFGSRCPCCGIDMQSWEGGQLGHWLRYSLCNGFFKYERVNMAMICAGCNFKDDAVTLKKLGETLQLRHGGDVLEFIDSENQRLRGSKMEAWAIVDYIARLRPDLVEISP